MSNEVDRKERWARAVSTYRAGDAAGALFAFKSLAMEGSQAAYVEIANLYEKGGENLNPDPRQAFEWYKKAVDETDDVEGYIGLGRLYFLGQGVDHDFEKARWYLSRAEANDKPGVYLMLGRIHHAGLGVPKDLKIAMDYYLKAKRHGNVHALRYLAILEMQLGNRWNGVGLRLLTVFSAIRILLSNGPRDPRLRQY